MRVLFISGRELKYPRNSLNYSFIASDHDVILAKGLGGGKSSILWRSLFSSLSVLFGFRKQRVDLIYVGFFGHIIVLILRLFMNQPIVFDAFVSAFDTICFDRKIVSPTSLFGRLALWLDKRACQLANVVLVDTNEHANFFHDVIGVPREKLEVIYVGCDDRIFFPIDVTTNQCLVLFYGTFLPLHGVETIIEAAKIVHKINPKIKFRLIGSSRLPKQILIGLASGQIENLQISPSVPLKALPEIIAGASICLCGHFGESDKAKRVVAGKTFQCIAMGKPVIVGDNRANREVLTHKKDAWFCEMGNSSALAMAICNLLDDQNLIRSLGKNARNTYSTNFNNKILSKKLLTIIEKQANRR